MSKRKSTLILLLSTAMLASCSGGSSSSSHPTGFSSDTSASGTQATSQDPSTSSKGGDTSASTPVSNVFNAYKFATQLVETLQKYRPNLISFDTLKKAVEDSGEAIDLSPSSEEKVSEIGAVLLYASAFKATLPERIGARSFQGFFFDPAKIEIRKAKDDSTNGAVYQALKYLGNCGIMSLPASSSVSGGKAYAEKNLLKILDRVHAYFGESPVDDFFSTVNHDYLYDENPNHDIPSDGRSSWEEAYDEEKLVNTYDSRLIPEEDIVEWSFDFLDQIPSAKNFIKTYTDWDSRVVGNAAGLVDGIKKYLAASTAEEFLAVLKEMAQETGYCILWDTYTAGNYALGGIPLFHVTSYNNTATSSEATSNRTTSVNRFTPIFHEVLGGEEEECKAISEDYADFKIALAKGREASKVDDTLLILTDDEEKIKANPKLYFSAKFGTGASVAQFFEDLGFEKDCILPNSAKDLSVIASLISDETLDLIKGMAVWQMLQHYTICLPDTEAVNAWAWKPGYGTNAKTLWDNKAAFYAYGMPYLNTLISNYWVETEQFGKDSEAVIGIVDGLKTALLDRIERADWVTEDAKEKATLKVNKLSYSIGGKNSDGSINKFEVPTYEDKSLYANIAASEDLKLDAAAGTVGKPAGELDFFQYVAQSDPLMANAFYAPSFNGINITLGYMACYDRAGDADDQKLVEDYGWVVAHEISHGFDSNGIYFDENGKRHEEGWFNPEDLDAYTLRCKGIADYYDGYEVMPEQKTPGKTVMTEAIADINGLHTALEFAKTVENFDYAHFFTAAAKNFASYASQYTYVAAGLAADEHPFGRARVNLAFKAMDEWHEAFGTEPGDAMYVAPTDRVKIW